MVSIKLNLFENKFMGYALYLFSIQTAKLFSLKYNFF
jgi:hypothetical protein